MIILNYIAMDTLFSQVIAHSYIRKCKALEILMTMQFPVSGLIVLVSDAYFSDPPHLKLSRSIKVE